MAFETFTRDTVLTEEGARRLVALLENPPEVDPKLREEYRKLKYTKLSGEEALAFLRDWYEHRND